MISLVILTILFVKLYLIFWAAIKSVNDAFYTYIKWEENLSRVERNLQVLWLILDGAAGFDSIFSWHPPDRRLSWIKNLSELGREEKFKSPCQSQVGGETRHRNS
jgi:hypothetical protein